ncbi:MAG: hypothetical protein N4A33_06910 [Bacteriovoracaceae bacterium]|jgi:hypothetical protein|nr:hypothetical protein [Bacteriovoracaceae bacterium]
MFRLAVLSFICSFSLICQDKISNKDLRGVQSILKISANNIELKIEKTLSDEYFFIKNNRSKIKLAKKDFFAFDELFTKNFIDMKYMMSAKPKKCNAYGILYMRGEELIICSSESEKRKMLKKLISYFK